MTTEDHRAGDPMPPNCAIIEVRLADLDQLFHTIDPSPFHQRQLDRDAEEFIVSRAREVPKDVPLGLVLYLDRSRSADADHEAASLRDAVHQFFTRRARSARRELRELFSRGRVSLAIGLVFMGVSTALAQAIGGDSPEVGATALVRESLLIAGWVAMWRPLEIFLYDWWPIRDQARCYDRLAAMPVAVEYASQARGVAVASAR